MMYGTKSQPKVSQKALYSLNQLDPPGCRQGAREAMKDFPMGFGLQGAVVCLWLVGVKRKCRKGESQNWSEWYIHL